MFRIFFCSLLTLLSLHRIEEIRVLLWMRLWLKGMLGWSDLSRPPRLSLYQQEGFLFLTIHVISGAALLISFKDFLRFHNMPNCLVGARGLALGLSWLSKCLPR